ncbi:MAG TPA: phosphate signaling complex protein PhoU [Methanolinea sp.]|nr:phosphate signaling complex protein PhoU [Methanolinea sp.]HQK56686.1 phosphate signaling complex protein PhoU [Methanolinea sp.]
MTDKFHEEMAEMQRRVLAMGLFAEGMLRDAVEALRRQDIALASDVKGRKRALSSQNDALEEEVYRMIALYQPVARDMRAVACALKVIASAERIGRYGKDIANVVIATTDARESDLATGLSIPHMAGLVLSMIDDSLRAYETGDLQYIRNHSERDDVVDALRHTIFREGITYMMEEPRTITRCMNYLMVARYLERCADHSCKIAEKVHYMVTGERIEIK